MNNHGKTGCGCLFFLLVIIMVTIGIVMHPYTMKKMGQQFRYADKIFLSDGIFIPRFPEDKNGEIYVEAFREYWAGNGKMIYVQEDRLLDMTVSEAVRKMAGARGIKDAAIGKIEVSSHNKREGADIIKETFANLGLKKVIIVVPEYASRRFHLFFSANPDESKTSYLIKPVSVSYFDPDKWWKKGLSRRLILDEIPLIFHCYFQKFKYGTK